MASTYNVEPPPTGKVLLKTTNGDIVLELFAKQIPLASRNFIQHCLDGYYDNTIFHRLVPGFIIQGGDPTGLGSGGESAVNDGAPFEDEFHSRLRFNRRGLLGMANTGPNDNTSQFFLTLDKTPELQGKNTMFGRVEGDTIYNLMKMAESELAEEGGDRPLYPPKVLGSEVLVNPFEGMEARRKIAQASKEEVKPKKKRKAAKGGLSFGDEEDVAPVVKKAKVNPDFKIDGNAADDARPQKLKPAGPAATEKRTRRRSTSSVSSSPEPTSNPKRISDAPTGDKPNARPQPESSPEPEQVQKTMSALERTNAEIAALKASMKRNTAGPEAKPEKKKSALEAMIPTTSTRGRKRGKAGDDDSAFKLFNSFKKRLGDTLEVQEDSGDRAEKTNGNHKEGADSGAADEEEKLCDLHFIVNCQSCKAWNDEDGNKDADDDDDPNWMSHQLSFAKDTLGKDLEWKRKMEEFEVIDPREKAKDIASDKRKHRDEGRRDKSRHGNNAKIPIKR
ncbi:cyclophilin-like domain-containing protein [Elsinoe ampelina]|uniref:Cyclophilin-like domain-containing protein n=1 Tax=Elsinoe ampelina TaxID=302913 RepID=A0A6A6G2M0_9PEZI|nr:cyclophilin-like domain-containing protein [Elsinoe ampelina]